MRYAVINSNTNEWEFDTEEKPKATKWYLEARRTRPVILVEVLRDSEKEE